MAKLIPKAAFRKLAALYDDMEKEYTVTASSMGHTCVGCSDNCCFSYFQHHTYIEWAYLWQGLKKCSAEQRKSFEEQAREYVLNAQDALMSGVKPHIMCPLNIDGLCGLYSHRLMICRMHGVPNVLHMPNGKSVNFPGCYLSQQMSESRDLPVLDRTPLYKRLVELEMAFVGPKKIRTLPRVDLTLAEMIVQGSPKLG